MTEQMDQSLEIIELREELQRTKLLLQNCNGDIVRADRELASLREQLKDSQIEAENYNRHGIDTYEELLKTQKELKQQEEVIRELIPIAEMVVIYKELIGKECKTEKAIIEKAKSLTTKDK